MLTEYWAHRFFDDPKLQEEIVDEDMDEEMIDRLMNDPDAWDEVMPKPNGTQ